MAVAFGGSQFVVVGEGGAALTSPDGITWTTRNSGTTRNLRSLAFSNGTFAASGGGRFSNAPPNSVSHSTAMVNVVTTVDGIKMRAALRRLQACEGG